jgi:hypothetical protein
MADADSVTPGLATLLAQGWDVTEPGEGGRWGGLPPEIPANIAGPLSQMFSTVARLGGRAYIPWSPAIGPSVFGNSDGSGGVPGVGGAVGLLLDASNGWGVPGAPDGLAALKNFTTGWLTSGTGSIVGPTQFSSTGVGGVVPSAAVPFTGGAYYIRIAGDTTCASGLRYTLSAGGAPNVIVTPSAGSFDFTAVLVLTGTDRHFFQNQSAGTTTIDWSRTQIREMVPNTALATALTQPTGINKPLLASGAVPWAGALEISTNRRMTSTAAASYITNADTPRFFALAGRAGPTSTTLHTFSAGKVGGTQTRVDMLYMNAGFSLTYLSRDDAGGQVAATLGPTSANQVFVIVGSVSAGAASVWLNGTNVTGSGAVLPTGSAIGDLAVGDFFSPSAEARGVLAYAQGPGAITAADVAVLTRSMSAIAGLPI